ncbi:uracil-DNA glycosylase [Pterulicium gracile]|uniref:Uracil-DNA glycosylase n=1 Tax=Pterulicium gracile TaxID=1884261 RepID=A0A5C3QC94_9AGAR|nr:uracil-DNA glycosylase [Pterula gracilis]
METESPTSNTTTETQDTVITSSATGNETATATTTSGSTKKRQRTIGEMFGPSSTTSKAPAAKRAKLEVTSTNKSVVSTSSKPSGPAVASISEFSLTKFKESLNPEERKLLLLECEAMDESWLALLEKEIRKPYFLRLKTFLWQEGIHDLGDIKVPLRCYPHPKDIYAWSNTPVGKVKVVIIGQDPYHNVGQAHGLCFSVPKGVKVPPSLVNIYSELKKEYPDFSPPKHGNLQAWVDDGVMLLNSCLTVRANTAASHSKRGWEDFTDKVVDLLDRHGGADLPSDSKEPGAARGLVWLAWGAFAIKRVSRLDKKRHLILQSPHPSPLSAHRGFLGNGHFKKANEWLEQRYGPEAKVDWCHLP